MTQGKPLKLLVSFAIPLMFGNVFQQLYTVVDTAIVGRGVGVDALAALGSVDWLNWMVLGIAFGFTQGFSMRIAQKFGEGDMEGLRQVAGQSALLSGIISIVCLLLVQLALPDILTLLNVREDLRGMAMLYTRILLGGLPQQLVHGQIRIVQRNGGCAVIFAPGRGSGNAHIIKILSFCVRRQRVPHPISGMPLYNRK